MTTPTPLPWETSLHGTWSTCRVADSAAGRFMAIRSQIGARRFIVKLNGKLLTLNGSGFPTLDEACAGADKYFANWASAKAQRLPVSTPLPLLHEQFLHIAEEQLNTEADSNELIDMICDQMAEASDLHELLETGSVTITLGREKLTLALVITKAG